jgi:hypothetical protein
MSPSFSLGCTRTRAELERLIVREVRNHPDCNDFRSITVRRLVDASARGAFNWTAGAWNYGNANMDACDLALRRIIPKLQCQYDLAEDRSHPDPLCGTQANRRVIRVAAIGRRSVTQTAGFLRRRLNVDDMLPQPVAHILQLVKFPQAEQQLACLSIDLDPLVRLLRLFNDFDLTHTLTHTKRQDANVDALVRVGQYHGPLACSCADHIKALLLGQATRATLWGWRAAASKRNRGTGESAALPLAGSRPRPHPRAMDVVNGLALQTQSRLSSE